MINFRSGDEKQIITMAELKEPVGVPSQF